MYVALLLALKEIFGSEFNDYKKQVQRWI